MTILTSTLLIQASSFTAAALPKLFGRAVSSPIGFVIVVFTSFWWFPKRWSGMELISCGYLVVFLCLEVLAYLLIWAVVALVREAREAASGG